MSEFPHKRIFVTHDTDFSYYPDDFMWADTKINDDDIEFIRADIVQAQIAEKDKALQKINDICENTIVADAATVVEIEELAFAALAPQDSDKEDTKGEQE